MLPACPEPLPSDIDGALRKLAVLWARHPARPRLKHKAEAHWDNLLKDWSEDKNLPLLIRKREKGVARGEVVNHDSGRKLIPTDNSPASWAYLKAFCGELLSLSDIHQALEADRIPVAMVVDGEMRARSLYKCCRVAGPNTNKLGWKVCHKRDVGLNGRTSIKDRPLHTLQSHFQRFLAPSNIFLVPLNLGGLGEVSHFIEAVAEDQNGL